jgi:hypothetical protein
MRFQNMSDEPAPEYFADGMVEDKGRGARSEPLAAAAG